MFDNNAIDVSVIIPAFNVEPYIGECVDSVLASVYNNYEIIIVDDGSTDNTLKKCVELASKDKRIKVYHKENEGVCATRNYAIERARGKYVLPLDGDDIIGPAYIRDAVYLLEKDDNLGIVYCKAYYIGLKSGEWKLPEYNIREMLKSNIIFVTAFFRREDWITVHGFDTKFENGTEDYDFWLSLLELGRKVYRIDSVQFFYRIRNLSRNRKLNKDIDLLADNSKHILLKHKQLVFDNYEVFIDLYIYNMFRIAKFKRKIPFYNVLSFFYDRLINK